MTYNTIDNDVTMAGDAEGALLAGRYRVVKQLGQGGMGSVWLAEDTQLDGKLFAIKMLPSILVSNKRAYAQLKSEALVAMKLSHPNIVTLRAFEENEGNPFLVMDYIDGETLDDHLAEKGKLSEDETVRILKPIAAALDYAHGEGVVHRDVKPANVMIRKDGHPFILDFGIAREIQETMTRVTGKLSSGTLLYMSPEQLRGLPPKPAQDVYSFAAMAYECLKSEPPFSRGQVEYQILNEKPLPLQDGVRLSVSIMRGLSKEPEKRPASCASVLSVVSVPKPSPQMRVQAYTPPRRVNSQMVAVPQVPQKSSIAEMLMPMVYIVVALVVLGGVIWYRNVQWKEETRKRAVAAQQAEAARRQQEEEERQAQLAARKKALEEQQAKQKKAEDERKAGEEAARMMEEESRAKDAVSGIRIEAKVQRGKVGRISVENGFKQKIEATDDLYIKAEALYDTQNWHEAAVAYTNYVDGCKTILSLDGLRQRAVAKRSEVQASFKKAEAAGAKTYDRDNWNAAVKTWNAANTEFRRMEFSAATVTFERAMKEFDLCTNETVINKRIAETNYKHGDTKTITLPGGAMMEIIYCAPGEFMMGSPIEEKGRTPDELIQHKEKVNKGFWLAKSEITQRQWSSVMGENPAYFKGDDRPVERVSWDDCQLFIRRINGKLGCCARLPTSKEWEYACRAGTTAKYPLKELEYYTEDHPASRKAFEDSVWYKDNSDKTTHAVGLKLPNAWGFHDMNGNVSEWCEDRCEAPSGMANNETWHVIRGGGLVYWQRRLQVIRGRLCTSQYTC